MNRRSGRASALWKARFHWTARVRLTVLYGVLMFVSGVALLAVANVLTRAVASDIVFVNPTLHSVPQSGNFYRPAPAQPGSQLAQLAAQAEAQRSGDLNALLVGSGIALGVITVGSVLLGWIVAGRVLRPVKAITATTRRISASNLEERLGLTGPNDEFTELADTLDDLLNRLQAAFVAQRQFVANAAHELRTPMTAERTALQVALADPNATAIDLRTTCKALLIESYEQEALVESLLTLASSQEAPAIRERIALEELVESAVVRTQGAESEHPLNLQLSLEPAQLVGDSRLLERLVSNLLSNAIQYNFAGGWVRVETRTAEGRARLTVENTGDSIPASAVERLFEPFQRLETTRVAHPKGHGLGLAITKAIAEAHGGTIEARPRPQGGLCVTVSFPFS